MGMFLMLEKLPYTREAVEKRGDRLGSAEACKQHLPEFLPRTLADATPVNVSKTDTFLNIFLKNVPILLRGALTVLTFL